MIYRIGVDAGGTKISAGLVAGNKLIRKIKIPTEQGKGRNQVIKNILKAISIVSQGIEKKEIEMIVIGLAGPVDSKNGILKVAPNIKGLQNLPVRKIVEKTSGIKTIVENDAKCVALAESRQFKCKNLIALTLGTGVGGGIIIDGKIYHGSGYAGELGHIVIDYKGYKCTCGNNGCLEEYCSGRGVERLAKKYFGKAIPPLEVQRMAEAGNKKAIRVYNEFGNYLGIGLADYVNIFNPEIIVIGGGIGRAWRLFLPSAIKEMRKRAFDVSSSTVKVVPSKLEVDEAGILGVSSLD